MKSSILSHANFKQEQESSPNISIVVALTFKVELFNIIVYQLYLSGIVK